MFDARRVIECEIARRLAGKLDDAQHAELRQIVAAEARGPCALAVTACVPPTVRAAVAGDTCKEVRPGARSETVIVAAVVIVAAAKPVPVPAAETVMVVVPGATAVTTPAAVTVAMVADDEVYV